MVGKQRPMMLSVALSGSFYQAPQAMQASAAPLSLQLQTLEGFLLRTVGPLIAQVS